LVVAQRHEKWMIYHLPEKLPTELDLQLRCLQDCVQSSPIFREDLRRRQRTRRDCGWVEQAASANKE
jgi:ArsR family transcriptional regulator